MNRTEKNPHTSSAARIRRYQGPPNSTPPTSPTVTTATSTGQIQRRFGAGGSNIMTPEVYASRLRERPPPPPLDVDDHRGADRLAPLLVLRVLRAKQLDGPVALRSFLDDARLAVGAHPPQLVPAFLVVVDEECHPRVRRDVRESLQLRRGLRFRVHDRTDAIAVDCEDDRDEVRRGIGADGRHPRHPRGGEPPLRLVLIHSGFAATPRSRFDRALELQQVALHVEAAAV